MAEPRSSPKKEVKAPNVFERAKEEIVAVFHHHKETHGLRKDLDENTSMSDVKAPNAFERAKEEIEAIVEAIHPKKEHQSLDSTSHGEKRNSGSLDCLESDKPEFSSEKDTKAPNLIERAKEKVESLVHKVSEVKGPNVFERAKEEIEALMDTIHPNKDSGKANK